MPYLCKDKFEKLKKGKHSDDLHVDAISNPKEAAFLAALKYVKNSHLDEKILLLDTEDEIAKSYFQSIVNQKNRQHLAHYSAYNISRGR